MPDAQVPIKIRDLVSYKTIPCKVLCVHPDGTLLLRDEEQGFCFDKVKQEQVALLKEERTKAPRGPVGGYEGGIERPVTVLPQVFANIPELQNLTGLERRFIAEYMRNPASKTGAYLAAGGRGTSEATIRTSAAILFKRPRVQTALRILNDVAGESCRWTVDKLLHEMNRQYEIVSAAVPVLNKNGKPTGKWVNNAAMAYKYIELQARMMGLTKDRLEVTGKDGAPLQVQHSVETLGEEHFARLTDEERITFYALYRKAKGEQPIIDGRPQPTKELTYERDQTDQDQGDREQSSQEAIPDAHPEGAGGEPEGDRRG